MINRIGLKLLLILLVTALIITGALSCSQSQEQPAEPETPIETPAEEGAASQQQEEEVIEVIEEQVDYDSASVGADIKGFVPSYLCLNQDNYIKIEITNNSDFTWKKDGEHMVRIGYHFYHKQQDTENYDNPTRTALEQDLKPGESATISVLVNDIEQEGDYILRIDPVLEGKYWFSSKGVQMLEGEVYFGPCSN